MIFYYLTSSILSTFCFIISRNTYVKDTTANRILRNEIINYVTSVSEYDSAITISVIDIFTCADILSDYIYLFCFFERIVIICISLLDYRLIYT